MWDRSHRDLMARPVAAVIFTLLLLLSSVESLYRLKVQIGKTMKSILQLDRRSRIGGESNGTPRP